MTRDGTTVGGFSGTGVGDGLVVVMGGACEGVGVVMGEDGESKEEDNGAVVGSIDGGSVGGAVEGSVGGVVGCSVNISRTSPEDVSENIR